MKKLTKRVQIFDLFIDVPKNTFHVVADSDGQLRAVSSEVTVIRGIDGWRYSVNDGGEVTCVCRVDLEGLNWWECCWFVGDQVDGEVALASLNAKPIAVTDISEIDDLKNEGWVGNFLAPDFQGIDSEDRVYLYTFPPVIKLPEDGFTGGRWCPEDREGYANGVSDCIEEMERLYSIK